MARTSKYQIEKLHPSVSYWRAALYLRLSREDGDKLESESILSQKALLNDYLDKRPDIKIIGVYSDDGFTGTNFDRPDFLRMFEDIRSGKINCVVVKDLSRFGRNYVESGKYLEVIFPTLKTRFISVNDNVDSIENPASVNNVMIPFKNIMNDEYCRDISLKVRSSLTIKRKNGQFIGSFAPYGYFKDPLDKHKLIIDDEAAEVIKLIFRLFLEGRSIIGISRYLTESGIKNISDYKRSKGLKYKARGKMITSGFWSDFMVRRILTSRVYCGDLVQKKTETVSYKVQVSRKVAAKEQIIVLNTHKAIIERDVFAKAQSLLKRDTRALKQIINDESLENSYGLVGLFSGFIKCGDCRRPMQKKTIKQPYKKYDYYICTTYKKVKECSKHTIRADVLENTVLKVIQKQIELAVDIERMLEKIKSFSQNNITTLRIKTAISNAEKEKEKINEIIIDLYPDYKLGLISKEQYLALKERYESQTVNLETKLKKLNEDLEKANTESNGEVFISTLKKHKNITALNREIVSELIDNIFIFEKGMIEIEFKFKDSYEDALACINKNKEALDSLNVKSNSTI